MRWLTIVTTTPQRENTLLPMTLSSLMLAGFKIDRLCVDGTQDPAAWQNKFGIEVTPRWPQIGCWGNWWLAVQEIWVRSRGSFDLLLVAQDDLKMLPGTRQFIEECFQRNLIPDKSYLNCMEFLHNFQMRMEQDQGRDHYRWYRGIGCPPRLRMPPGYQRGLGAVALVFTREGVKTLLSASCTVDKPLDIDFGYRKTDGQVVTAMNIAGWSEWVCGPTLTQHLGHVTTIHGPGPKQTPHPQSPSWMDNFNAMQILDRYAQQGTGGSR